MSGPDDRSGAEVAYAAAAVAGPVVMHTVPLIPVGTITLCRCRKAIHITGHDMRNRPYWTHTGPIGDVCHPQPLRFIHAINDTAVQLILARREIKQLRAGVRARIHDRLARIFATSDWHEATVYSAEDLGADEDRWVCTGGCGFVGTEQEWCVHIADALADVLEAE